MNFEKSKEYSRLIHTLIPGGAHTYSKGDDQFPLLSPAAISHGKGAYIWDIDGNKFIDCSMGLTSVGIGHANEFIIDRVKKELEKGVNFQRPSVIELEMAQKFLSLVPQHQMIKFAKNGSTVTTAAVKLARAYTNRKLVAFPFDHPFYSYDDWFIGKTACNKGVPDEISALSVTYKSCNLASLTALFEKYPNQIACVISEPLRSTCDQNCDCGGNPEIYLKQSIELIHKNGALFIQDEMITGFKIDLPGAITKYNVVPDLATWGKGIANGFSFAALTGIKKVMEIGGIVNRGEEKVFLISTTNGAETHSIAAGIATIDFFKSNNVINKNHKTGKLLIDKINSLIQKKGLSEFVELTDSPWMILFTFRDKNKSISNGLKTLMMQEMISKGVLFQGAFVPCFSHNIEEVNFFADAFEDSMETLHNAINKGYEKYLIGEPITPVFRKKL